MLNSKRLVLLVEDEEHIAKLISFKLNQEGFDVQATHHGEEALKLLAEQKWALVILDVWLPGSDGWEVLRTIRAEATLASLPVLMLTARKVIPDVKTALETGKTRLLSKPFDPMELARLVHELAGAGG